MSLRACLRRGEGAWARLACRLAWVGLAALGLGCSTLPPPHTSAQAPSPIVDYCQLFSVPEQQEVRVLAVYRVQFESSELVDRRHCLGSAMWVDFTETAGRSSGLPALRQLRSNWGAEMVVVLQGHYECNRSGDLSKNFGHENLYDCRFTANAIERVVGRVTLPAPPLD